MTKFGTWPVLFSLLCFWASSPIALGAEDAESVLREKVVNAAWTAAEAADKKESGPHNMITRTHTAAKIADGYRKANAKRTGDADKQKQGAYDTAYESLVNREAELLNANELLSNTKCTLTVVYHEKGKTDDLQKTIDLEAAHVLEVGDFLYLPGDNGELKVLTEKPKDKVKSILEVNLFHPSKVDGNKKGIKELDNTRFGIGVKETIFPVQEKDSNGDPVPSVNFASQAVGDNLSGLSVIGFGPINKYRVECK